MDVRLYSVLFLNSLISSLFLSTIGLYAQPVDKITKNEAFEWVKTEPVSSEYGVLKGKLTDIASKEVLLFANVALYQKGEVITGGVTDFDGNYHIPHIKPGIYDIAVSYVGYKKNVLTQVEIKGGQLLELNSRMTAEVDPNESWRLFSPPSPYLIPINLRSSGISARFDYYGRPSLILDGVNR